MSKINETNYPRRPQSDYEDTDMLIIQEAGGNTYTTRIEDIREDCQETIAPTVEAVNDALAPPENGSTASQSYAIGEHFMRNGNFCTAIAAITSGASFTLNTNYVVGTIAEALESLNSDLANKIDIGNALAVFGYRLTQNLNAHDLTSGLYIIRPSYVSNMPSELTGATSYTMLLGTGQSDEAVQILLNSAQNYLWFRHRYGSWSAWTKIAFS